MKRTVVTALMVGALIISMPAFAEDSAEAVSTDNGKHAEKSHEGKDRQAKFMEKIDKDGDGAISKSEFLSKHEEHFSKADTDGDGLLTKEEMKEAKKAMKAKRAEKRAERGDKPREGKKGSKGEAVPVESSEE